MQILRTTILIDDKSIRLIKKATLLKKRRDSEILNMVIREIIRKYLRKSKNNVMGTVKYQDHKDDFVVYHYSVNSDLYEACLDLRKLFKMSVSRIINEAIKEILGELLRESRFNSFDISLHSDNFYSLLDNYKFIYTTLVESDLENNEFAVKIRMYIT